MSRKKMSVKQVLKRVALGIPFVVGPLVWSGCPTIGSCPDPQTETIVVTEAPDGGTDCYAACPGESPSGVPLAYCVSGGGDAELSWTCTYEYICVGGRRPELPKQSFVCGPEEERTRWLLELAIVEAASVPAFGELAEALRAHGAPQDLIARAEASAADEVRHARLAMQLAGEGAIRLHVPASPTPTLEALARANAAEGCIREAYGALEAAWQSAHAEDPEVRAVFGTIAADEARHALLSMDIDRWLRGSVPEEAVREAREVAVQELQESFAERIRPAGLGLPSEAESRALLELALAA